MLIIRRRCKKIFLQKERVFLLSKRLTIAPNPLEERARRAFLTNGEFSTTNKIKRINRRVSAVFILHKRTNAPNSYFLVNKKGQALTGYVEYSYSLSNIFSKRECERAYFKVTK